MFHFFAANLLICCIVVGVLTRVLIDAQQFRVGANGKVLTAGMEFCGPNGLLVYNLNHWHESNIVRVEIAGQIKWVLV